MIQELGHDLGIGTLWTTDGFWLNGTTYNLTQSAYNSKYSITRSKIPVEDGGGQGTGGAHWENNYRAAGYEPGEPYYPAINDIMIGWISNLNITNISLAFLNDLGYNVIQNSVLAYSAVHEEYNDIPVHCRCGECAMINKVPNISMYYNKENKTILKVH
jgi:hypothetical protein